MRRFYVDLWRITIFLICDSLKLEQLIYFKTLVLRQFMPLVCSDYSESSKIEEKNIHRFGYLVPPMFSCFAWLMQHFCTFFFVVVVLVICHIQGAPFLLYHTNSSTSKSLQIARWVLLSAIPFHFWHDNQMIYLFGFENLFYNWCLAPMYTIFTSWFHKSVIFLTYVQIYLLICCRVSNKRRKFPVQAIICICVQLSYEINEWVLARGLEIIGTPNVVIVIPSMRVAERVNTKSNSRDQLNHCEIFWKPLFAV